jgi:hypothetical protein
VLAISVRQPWADLILNGQKSVEVRKSTTSYRGPILIHAALIQDRTEFKRAGIDPSIRNSYVQQALTGVVVLVNIIRLDEERWNQLRHEHLLPGRWLMEEHKFAWFLEHPSRIAPIHYRGLPRSFDVAGELLPRAIRDLSHTRRRVGT